MKPNSLEYFFKTVRDFRELMGQKTFWLGEHADDRRRNALKCLGHVYLNLILSTDKERETAETLFFASLNEFTRREFHAARLGSEAA